MDCVACGTFLTNVYCVQSFKYSDSTILPFTSFQVVKMEVVSTSVGKFTVDLFNKLNETNKGKNIFFSPWSISAALALTYLGAKGTTATEMAEVGCFCTIIVGRTIWICTNTFLSLGETAVEGSSTLQHADRSTVLVVWEGDGATHCYFMGFIVTTASASLLLVT